MRRAVMLVSTVFALAVVGGESAAAATNGSGDSGDAPGQAQASERCFAAFLRQYEGGIAAGGGPKYALDTGEVPGIAPLNCDHFWQGAGAIGSG